MHVDVTALIAGAGVGLIVGMTGSGGGALLTPILILFLGVNAKTSVASDLVATLFMRPVAAAVHLRRKTIHWPVVLWLTVGSMPTAFVSGWLSHWLIPASRANAELSPIIGGVLIVAGTIAIVRRARRVLRQSEVARAAHQPYVTKPVRTLLIGVVGGLAVGITSVGSGTLMLVGLGVLYPMLGVGELVGTDLVQAIPLVGAAALGHLVGGSLHVSLTMSVILGGVPTAVIGAFLARYVPDAPLGSVVAAVILGSGCALIGWRAGSVLGVAALLLIATILLKVRRARRVPASPACEPVPVPVLNSRGR